MKQQGKAQRQVAAIAAVAGGILLLCCLAAVIVWVVQDRSGVQPAAATPSPAQTSATLTIAYSSEKAALIKSLAEKFNARNLRTPDRQPMKVELLEMASGDMVDKALSG